MWCLKKYGENSDILYLYTGEELTVARQENAWLSITNDPSISRRHATLSVCHSIQNVKNCIPSTVQLKDLNSKNGVYVRHGAGDVKPDFVEKDRLPLGSTVTLANGDAIRFGIYKNCYQLCKKNFLVATSMIKNTGPVLEDLCTIGASFTKTWKDECTHLVMDSIKMSPKVVCALACCSAIVTPKFLKALCLAITAKDTSLPLTKPFIPQITESNIRQDPSLFEKNIQRQTLFKNKLFLFSSHKASVRVASTITAAGGECQVLSLAKHASALQAMTALLVRTVEDTNPTQDSNYFKASELLKKWKVHSVPESDIALAILYCDLDRHCNPSLSQHVFLASTASTQSAQLSSCILARETQTTSPQAAPPTRPQIPETPSTCSSKSAAPKSTAGGNQSRKRFLSDNETASLEPAPKKPAMEEKDPETQPLDGTKIEPSDETDTQPFDETTEQSFAAHLKELPSKLCSTQIGHPNTSHLPPFGVIPPTPSPAPSAIPSFNLPSGPIETLPTSMDGIPDEPPPTLDLSFGIPASNTHKIPIKRTTSPVPSSGFVLPTTTVRKRIRQKTTEDQKPAIKPGPPSMEPTSPPPAPVTTGNKRSLSAMEGDQPPPPPPSNPPPPDSVQPPPTSRIKLEPRTEEAASSFSSNFIAKVTVVDNNGTAEGVGEESSVQKELVELCKTVVEHLVLRRSFDTTSSNNQTTSSNTRNFKLFKKKSLNGTDSIQALPRIIGGRDLAPHTLFNTSSIDEWLTQNPDVSTLLQEERLDEAERQRSEDQSNGHPNGTMRGTQLGGARNSVSAGFSLPTVTVRGRRRK